MVPRYVTRSALVALSCMVFSNAQGAVVYDESVAGDLSDSGLSPTVLHLGLRSDLISGTTGFGAPVVDRDYFSMIVPSRTELSSLTVLPGTSEGGDVSFIEVPEPEIYAALAVGLGILMTGLRHVKRLENCHT
jgi:hypothetical protein